MGLLSKATVGRYVSLLMIITLLAVPMGSADTTGQVLGQLAPTRPACIGGMPGEPDADAAFAYADSCGGTASGGAVGAGTIIFFEAVDAGRDGRAFVAARAAAAQETAAETAGQAAEDAQRTANQVADIVTGRVYERTCLEEGKGPQQNFWICHDKSPLLQQVSPL